MAGVISLGRKSSPDQCLYDCLKYQNARGCEFHTSTAMCSVHRGIVSSSSGFGKINCLVLPGNAVFS